MRVSSEAPRLVRVGRGFYLKFPDGSYSSQLLGFAMSLWRQRRQSRPRQRPVSGHVASHFAFKFHSKPNVTNIPGYLGESQKIRRRMCFSQLFTHMVQGFQADDSCFPTRGCRIAHFKNEQDFLPKLTQTQAGLFVSI